MSLRETGWWSGSLLACLLAGVGWSVVGGAEPGIPETAIDVSPVVPRTLPTATVMHAKLTSTQQVLAGLLAEDYAQIAAAAQELASLARDVPARTTGEAASDRVYEHFRDEMLRLSAELKRMGEEENLAGAAYVHGNLTAACIGCHQHLRDAADAQIELMQLRPTRALFEIDRDAPAVNSQPD